MTTKQQPQKAKAATNNGGSARKATKQPTQRAKEKPLPGNVLELKGNPNNPRKPWRDDAQRNAFQKSLAEFGDLSGVVFNSTTGQLVGGHKRVEEFKQDTGAKLTIDQQLDKPDATGTTAYGHITLTTGTRFAYRVVKWNQTKENAANLAANKWGEGMFELAATSAMLEDLKNSDFDLDVTGFSIAEAAFMHRHVRRDNIVEDGTEGANGVSGEITVDDQFNHCCPRCKFQFN